MKRTPPPRVATWVLRRFGSQYRRDALLGDLNEAYQQGRSSAWYWRQVIGALVAGANGALRRRSPMMAALMAWWCILLALTFALKWPVIIFALDPTLYLLYRSKRHARRMRYGPTLVLMLVALCLAPYLRQPVFAAEIVSFHSGDKVLQGLLYMPAGRGPFPAVLYNHGSAPGMLNNQAFDLIGPLFTARGWAFFAPPGTPEPDGACRAAGNRAPPLLSSTE